MNLFHLVEDAFIGSEPFSQSSLSSSVKVQMHLPHLSSTILSRLAGKYSEVLRIFRIR